MAKAYLTAIDSSMSSDRLISYTLRYVADGVFEYRDFPPIIDTLNTKLMDSSLPEVKKEAKDIIKEREREKAGKTIGELGMAEVAKSIREGKAKSLKLILKTDVAGSLKAIKDSVIALSTSDVKVEVIGQGVGEVSGSDIELARATEAVVFAFKVCTKLSAKMQALQEKVKISNYDVIYELIDDVAAALEGLLEPEIIEEDTG